MELNVTVTIVAPDLVAALDKLATIFEATESVGVPPSQAKAKRSSKGQPAVPENTGSNGSSAPPAPATPVTQEGLTISPPTESALPPAQSEAVAPVTLEQVRAKLSALSNSGKREQVKALISSFNVANLSALPAEQYGDIMAKAEAL